MQQAQRALIVEDRSDWQSILAGSLQQLGWDYDVVANYDAAIRTLRQAPYDLAIIDPVLDNDNQFNRDGLRVLEFIVRHRPDTRVMIVTGSLDPSALEKKPDLPPDLIFLYKHEWDRDAFTQMLLTMRHPRQQAPRRTTEQLPVVGGQKQLAQPDDDSRPGQPRILIVEDRPDWQLILAECLEEQGWFWRAVDNADTALQLLQGKRRSFHVVVLDLRLKPDDMPLQEGSGWRLLNFLEQADQRTDVVVISGEASRGDVADLFMKYNIASFFDKDSFDKEEFIQLLADLTAPPRLYIQTLGGFAIWRDGSPLDDFGSSQVEAMLKMLVARPGQIIGFNELLHALFTADMTSQLRGEHPVLRAVIDSARHLLEPYLSAPEHSAFILKYPHGYQFQINDNVTPDYQKLDTLLEEGKALQADGEEEAALAAYESVGELYQGEFLPDDRSARWTVPLRNQTQTQYARILNRLADLYAKQGRFEEAIATAQKCLAVDAYHESTHRRLMRYHQCNGDTQAALTVYNTLAKLLREFFQERPSLITEALREAIITGATINCTEQ